eukprot:UN12188
MSKDIKEIIVESPKDLQNTKENSLQKEQKPVETLETVELSQSDDKGLVIIQYDEPTESLRIDVESNCELAEDQTVSAQSPTISPIRMHSMYSNSISLSTAVVGGEKVLRRSIMNKTYVTHKSEQTGNDNELDFDIEESPSLDDNGKKIRNKNQRELRDSLRLKKPLGLESKHNKSASVPIDIDEYITKNPQIDIEQLIRKFNILSKYGVL